MLYLQHTIDEGSAVLAALNVPHKHHMSLSLAAHSVPCRHKRLLLFAAPTGLAPLTQPFAVDCCIYSASQTGGVTEYLLQVNASQASPAVAMTCDTTGTPLQAAAPELSKPVTANAAESLVLYAMTKLAAALDRCSHPHILVSACTQTVKSHALNRPYLEHVKSGLSVLLQLPCTYTSS